MALTRGITRLDGARGKNKFGTPMFEPEVFPKQMYCIEEVLVTLLGLFGASRSASAPWELCLPPRYAPGFNELETPPLGGLVSQAGWPFDNAQLITLLA